MSATTQDMPDDIKQGDTVLMKVDYAGEHKWMVGTVQSCFPPGTKYGKAKGWADDTLHVDADYATDPFSSAFPYEGFRAYGSEIIELKVIERNE